MLKRRSLFSVSAHFSSRKVASATVLVLSTCASVARSQEATPPAPAGRATDASSASFDDVTTPTAEPTGTSGQPATTPTAPIVAPSCPSCPDCPAVVASSDPDAVFRAFDAFASEQQGIRIAGGIGAMAAGGTTMIVGSVLAQRANASAEPWLILGGVTAGIGLMSLVFPSGAESIRAEFRTNIPGHSAREAELFERAWVAAASRARSQRHFNAVFNFVLGAAGIGVGAAILSGSINMSDDERSVWGAVLVGSGAGLGIAGVTSLFVASPLEAAYAQYVGTKPGGVNPYALGAHAVPGGMTLELKGAF